MTTQRIARPRNPSSSGRYVGSHAGRWKSRLDFSLLKRIVFRSFLREAVDYPSGQPERCAGNQKRDAEKSHAERIAQVIADEQNLKGPHNEKDEKQTQRKRDQPSSCLLHPASAFLNVHSPSNPEKTKTQIESSIPVARL